MKKIIYLLISLSICVFGACDHKQTTDLKIMTYNIRHGVGMDTILDLSRAAEIIIAQAPDLCGLQEIDNYCLRSDSVGQTEFLAQKSLMTGTFSQFMAFDGGEYGMATLSAKPLISTKLLRLPDGIEEPRTSIIHEVELEEDCSLVFVNVHLDWIESDQGISSRLDQAKVLMQYVDSINKPVIITGDFNCTPDSPTMTYFYEQGFEFVEKGADNLSFQGDPKVELDHVIIRSTSGVKIKTKSISLLEEPMASDHRPLIAEFEIVY